MFIGTLDNLENIFIPTWLYIFFFFFLQLQILTRVNQTAKSATRRRRRRRWVQQRKRGSHPRFLSPVRSKAACINRGLPPQSKDMNVGEVN